MVKKLHRYGLKQSVPWVGSWYRRKDGSFRHGKRGWIRQSSPTGRLIGQERIRENIYGPEKKGKSVRAGLFAIKKKK